MGRNLLGGQAMPESVTISLEHYEELKYYEKQFKVLKEVREDLIKILNDESFTIENEIDKKIYNIYEKIVRKETMQ